MIYEYFLMKWILIISKPSLILAMSNNGNSYIHFQWIYNTITYLIHFLGINSHKKDIWWYNTHTHLRKVRSFFARVPSDEKYEAYLKGWVKTALNNIKKIKSMHLRVKYHDKSPLCDTIQAVKFSQITCSLINI